MARTSAAARPLTDHQEIRSWAEERGAKPACVRRTGGKGDVGMIRLDFPGYSGEGSLQPISWGEWFQKFDDSNLALLVQDQTAGGEQSNFNKLVSRESAETSGERASARSGSARSSGRRTTGSSYSGTKAGEDLDEHEYIEMDEADREDMEDADLELEEDELQDVATGGRDGAGRSKRKRQVQTKGRARTRSGIKARQTARGRNRRRTARGTSTQSGSARGRKRGAGRSTSSQSRSARGRKGSGTRKTAGKKAPGRVEMKSRRSSRRRAA
jgi:hypothetical protein